MRLAVAIVLTLPLAACGERPPIDVSAIPDTLLTCADGPTWRRGGTQRNAALHVRALRDAHADCKGKLAGVHSIAKGETVEESAP